MMENGLKENGDDTEEKEEEPYAERGRIMLEARREAALTTPYCQAGACRTVARKAQHGAKSHAARCIGHRTEVLFTVHSHTPHQTPSFAHDHSTQPPVWKPHRSRPLHRSPSHPKRHPYPPTQPSTAPGNAPRHGRESSTPTPFARKCMKRRKFPLPLQGETICLGTR